MDNYNLCPTMIHVGALDFRECRTEEVIRFFDAQCIWSIVL